MFILNEKVGGGGSQTQLMVKKGRVDSWVIVCRGSGEPILQEYGVGELPESLEMHFSQRGGMNKCRITLPQDAGCILSSSGEEL